MKKQYFPFIILLSILSACSDNSDFDATGTFEATEIIVSAESNGKLFRLGYIPIFPPGLHAMKMKFCIAFCPYIVHTTIPDKKEVSGV